VLEDEAIAVGIFPGIPEIRLDQIGVTIGIGEYTKNFKCRFFKYFLAVLRLKMTFFKVPRRQQERSLKNR